MSWSAISFKDFYVDIPIVCKDCGMLEIWTARQQQWWYEAVQGPVEKTAVRCRACRRTKRRRDAEMTERAKESRLARGRIRADELSRKLAAERPEAFEVLRRPLKELRLRHRVEKILIEQGIATAGDLVACDPAVRPPKLMRSDWEDLKRILKGLGFPVLGAAIKPPNASDPP
jgi:hypothetical protein